MRKVGGGGRGRAWAVAGEGGAVREVLIGVEMALERGAWWPVVKRSGIRERTELYHCEVI